MSSFIEFVKTWGARYIQYLGTLARLASTQLPNTTARMPAVVNAITVVPVTGISPPTLFQRFLVTVGPQT